MKYFESEKMELKLQASKSMYNTISAFANGSGGVVIIGIDDKGIICGVKEVFKEKIRIENQLNDIIRPRINYNISIIEVEEKELIEISVYAGDTTPYTVNGVAYVRKESNTVPAAANELVFLALRGKNLTYDQLPVDDKNLTFNAFARYLEEAKGVKEVSRSILMTLGLLKDGKYNLAAKLISDENNFAFGLELARFSKDVSKFISRDSLKDISIIDQFDKAVEFLQINYPPVDSLVGVIRKPVEQYPIDAFREVIANAIVHRDYSLNANINVMFFDNRVEVVSPGPLPDGTDLSDFENFGHSLVRNQIIAQAFFTIGLIEKFGTGYWKITKAYQNTPMKPRFVVSSNSVRVILPNLVFDDSQLTLENRIINYLEVNVKATRSELESKFGLSKKQAHVHLSTMVSKGLIKLEVSGPSSYYSRT